MNKEIYLYNVNQMKNPEVKMWMCFPSIYSFSLSSLGYLWISKEYEERDDVYVERVCSDTELTHLSPKELDFIAFSFSFDLDFLNIFKMLEKYNIPLKSEDRDETYPLVMVGGPVVTANPIPYSNFFDVFFIGDGEGINSKVVDIYKANKGKSKDEILRALSELEGVFVPKYKKDVQKATAKLDNCVYTPIISEDAYFKNTFIVEIARGCSNCCAFCLASYLNLPQRNMHLDKVLEALELGLSFTNKIALLGANVCAHPDMEAICNFLLEKMDEGREIEMTISSLRADKLSPLVVKTLVRAGQKSATVALEAGSERLRKVINKHISKEQFYNTVKIAQENGLKGLKVYCMYGIPTETTEDLEELVEFAKDLKKTYKGFDLSYAFSTFVPKPHTPFQWCKREESKSLEKKELFLKKEFHKLGLKVSFSSIKWDYFQTVLSRGDETLTDYLLDVYKNGGNLGAFKKSAKGLIDFSNYIDEIDVNSELAWDFIKFRPNKTSLLQEHSRLLS